MVPKVTLADDSNRIQLYDVLFRYAVGAAESNGALSMLEVTVPARTLIKPHMHTREDEFTLVVGITVYRLSVGPPWWWGDASPLGAVKGKVVTIDGEQAEGSDEVDVLAIDGKVIREPGRPPWAGGWKVVGSKHPGWAQWKVDKLAGKGLGKPGIADEPSPGP